LKAKPSTGPIKSRQSDITYFDVKDRFAYIVFLIDIYSKVIVGHQVSNHMRKGANLKALKGAINKFGAPQIHHSDRGSQYGSQAYIDLLAKHQVQISMAKSGHKRLRRTHQLDHKR
jgi:putative transposase